MRKTSIAGCALPGLLLGVCFAATAAQPQDSRSAAHKPAIDAKTGRLLRPLTLHERQDMAAKVASRQRLVKQPRTVAEAKPTLVQQADGSAAMQVPTELWSHMAAQTDAQGRVQVREFEGNDLPVVQQEGSTHE